MIQTGHLSQSNPSTQCDENGHLRQGLQATLVVSYITSVLPSVSTMAFSFSWIDKDIGSPGIDLFPQKSSIGIDTLCLPAGCITIPDRITMIDDLKAAGKLPGIKLLDHIIFIAKGYYNLLEHYE